MGWSFTASSGPLGFSCTLPLGTPALFRFPASSLPLLFPAASLPPSSSPAPSDFLCFFGFLLHPVPTYSILPDPGGSAERGRCTRCGVSSCGDFQDTSYFESFLHAAAVFFAM